MSMKWNKIYKLGTDVAGFAFHHPARLAHREQSPIDWWDKAEKESRTGRMVAFQTGADGTFTLMFVKRALTQAEEKALVVSQAFRYLVEDGRVYWDNTNCLPCEDGCDDAEEDKNGWLKLPNGRYRFTVNAMDWHARPAAERKGVKDYTHYLVQIEPVASFRGVPVLKTAPWLIASKESHAEYLKQLAAAKKPPKKREPKTREAKCWVEIDGKRYYGPSPELDRALRAR